MMSNYDIEKSQKQKEQWRDYVDKSLQHPLDSSEATRMPMSAPVVLERDDKDDIKNILKSSKPTQQWDAQSQSYVEIDEEHYGPDHPEWDDRDGTDGKLEGDEDFNDQDNIRRICEDTEVTNPKHYVGFEITPLDYITANELDFLEGNIIKYISRYPHKGGVNDLLKARTYLEKLIEREAEKE